MSKKLQKFFQYCLSKLKNPSPRIHSPSSKNWIFSRCKHPTTPSFAIARRNDDAATLSDIDRFLFENFQSLFLDHEDTTSNNNNINKVSDQENPGAPKSGSASFDPTPLDLLGALSESSNSDESIVVLACSASPYEDFLRSMKEMVEARLRNYGRVDWGFMEELLFCYLNLNEKKSHKFILSAFVDLINILRERSPERAPARAKPRSVRTFRTRREIRREKEDERSNVGTRGIEKLD